MTTQPQTKPAPTEERLPLRKLIDRNSKYFCADDMPASGGLTVKIERVQQHGKLEGFAQGKTTVTRAPLLYFAGIEKPFGVKKLVGDQIISVLGSEFPLDWIGHLLHLIVVRDLAFGKMTDLVRVAPKKPTEADWQRCQKGYKAPPFDLDAAILSFANAQSLDELIAIKAGMRSVPKQHHATLLESYNRAEAALQALAEQRIDDEAHGDDAGVLA